MNAQYARLVITNNYFLAEILYYFFFEVGVEGKIGHKTTLRHSNTAANLIDPL